MTKEELEKEAEEYATENYEQCIYDDVIGWETDYEARKQAYLTGAEPREKRIEELEATNKKISDECHKLVDSLEKKQNKNELLETQNIKLQAEVSRLTIKNAELKELIKNIIRVTWGEGWNYSLDWKVKAEQFIKENK